MLLSPLVVGFAFLTPIVGLPTAFWQITPAVGEPGEVVRSANTRAVLLIHGLLPHPFRPEKAQAPGPHTWQKPTAEVVRTLANDADVFGFSYAQTVPVDLVVCSRGLQVGIAQLRKAGYREIVLVGHSAGGLVARQFVERFPDSGVTKVIAVATPHAGAGLAKLPAKILPGTQVPFIRSLAPNLRKASFCELAPEVEFCCLVCKLPRLAGDSVVTAASQWPEDLQRQGIPAVVVPVTHFEAMKDPKAVAQLAELVKGKLTRWTPEQVAAIRKVLWKESAEDGKK